MSRHVFGFVMVLPFAAFPCACVSGANYLNDVEAFAGGVDATVAEGKDFGVKDIRSAVDDMAVQADEGVDLFAPNMAALPSTCREVRAANPDATDGLYTLYFRSDPTRPWQAYCLDIQGSALEYLPLPNGGNTNYSQYTAGGASPGTDVRTDYTRVRIDPTSLLVDVSDAAFATSTGRLVDSGGAVVTSMSYAAAMDCAPKGYGIPTGRGNVDLRGTPFAISVNSLFRGPPASSHLCGMATFSNANQTVDLTGGGFCGYLAAGDYGMFGVPYNGGGGFQLPLVFR